MRIFSGEKGSTAIAVAHYEYTFVVADMCLVRPDPLAVAHPLETRQPTVPFSSLLFLKLVRYLHESRAIFWLQRLDTKRSFDVPMLESFLPAAWVPTQVHPAALAFASRVKLDMAIGSTHQPKEVSLGTTLPTGDTCTLWNVGTKGQNLSESLSCEMYHRIYLFYHNDISAYCGYSHAKTAHKTTQLYGCFNAWYNRTSLQPLQSLQSLFPASYSASCSSSAMI